MSKTVTGEVGSKIETPIPQPLNGKMMIHHDFPLKRQRVHHIFLKTGEHKIVSAEEYDRIKVGDTETVYISDPPNWKYIAVAIAVFVLLVVLMVYG